jgi:DNA primase catalytic subunit
MRAATLAERQEFYRYEFNFAKATEWLKLRQGKTQFAVIIGRHTKIYPQKYRDDADTTIIINQYTDLTDVWGQVLEFLPEAVYYDRNLYDNAGRAWGQELAFDVDPENFTCPIHGTLADKMARHQGLSFCAVELELAKQQTVELCEFLEQRFSLLRVVYSGRGFHIHVFDEETFEWSSRQRVALAAEVKAAGFGIDAWVTEGEMRLIRLPYSLHGMVSRVALPLEKGEVDQFNPITDPRCMPLFLHKPLS